MSIIDDEGCCRLCDGTGEDVHETSGFGFIATECPHCEGTGKRLPAPVQTIPAQEKK